MDITPEISNKSSISSRYSEGEGTESQEDISYRDVSTLIKENPDERVVKRKRNKNENNLPPESDTEFSIDGEIPKIYSQSKTPYREISIFKLPFQYNPNKNSALISSPSKILKRQELKKPGQVNKIDNFSQTKAMAFLTKEKADVAYKKIFPLREDFVFATIPSRKLSMQEAIANAKSESEIEKLDQENELKNETSTPSITKIKKSCKKSVLPDLPKDYYKKSESFWTGSEFSGQYKNRQFNLGVFNYPTNAKYESEFKEGYIHSKKHLGVITYPRGDQFEGQWRKGRYISGKITFFDGLEFNPTKEWDYCGSRDRRLFWEKSQGISTSLTNLILNDRVPRGKINYGYYDVGDGKFNPETGIITDYEGNFLRKANDFEYCWILQHCRKEKSCLDEYNACFTRLPGDTVLN